MGRVVLYAKEIGKHTGTAYDDVYLFSANDLHKIFGRSNRENNGRHAHARVVIVLAWYWSNYERFTCFAWHDRLNHSGGDILIIVRSSKPYEMGSRVSARDRETFDFTRGR